MKCPIHKVRPNYLKEIPLVGRANTVDQQKTNQSNESNQEDAGRFNSIRSAVYGDTDTE